MTERVETVSYIDAVNRLDAGDYDDKPDEGMFIHLAIASGGNPGIFRLHITASRDYVALADSNSIHQ